MLPGLYGPASLLVVNFLPFFYFEMIQSSLVAHWKCVFRCKLVHTLRYPHTLIAVGSLENLFRIFLSSLSEIRPK